MEAINLIILGILFFTAYTSYGLTVEVNPSYFLNQEEPMIVKGRKLLVLGDEMTNYQHSTSATPFINWQISKEIFENTGYYDNLIYILEGISKDPPQMIIDSNNVWEKVREQIPSLKKQYIPVPNYPGLYINANN